MRHYLAFFMQMRPALYVALIAISPLTLLIDRILPAERFAWSQAGQPGSLPMKASSRLKTTVAVLAVLAAIAGPAAAFCGFYVAKADSKLFNKSSKVVLTRDGNTTAITMASDYEGEPKEFAVVIPVPTFIERKQIGVVEMKTIDHLDGYTAPRLVEYHDGDPCTPLLMPMMALRGAVPVAATAPSGALAGRYRGVTD